ncbi:MAG: cytochrome b [Legionellales bacterium]|nr:cytochrome b [Legionellales bacterium]
MSIKNTKNSYGSLSKFFHWVCALMVIILLVVGFVMDNFSDLFRATAYNLHKSNGIVLMVIMLMRAIWMLANPKPAMPNDTPKWEIMAASLTHYAFYILLIIMPLSGWLMSCAYGYPPKFFGMFSLPLPGITKNIALAKSMQTIHLLVAKILVALISIHIIAALKHHFIHKDALLLRMLPGHKN